MIHARTRRGLRAAVDQLGGHLSGRVRELRARLLRVLAHLEAEIDFPEDDVPPSDVSPLLAPLLAEIRGAGRGTPRAACIMRQGVRTALVGRPNVGQVEPAQRAAAGRPRHRHADPRHDARHAGRDGQPGRRALRAGGYGGHHRDAPTWSSNWASRAAATPPRGRADLVLLVIDAARPLTAADEARCARWSPEPPTSRARGDCATGCWWCSTRATCPPQVTAGRTVGRLLPGVPLVAASALTAGRHAARWSRPCWPGCWAGAAAPTMCRS